MLGKFLKEPSALRRAPVMADQVYWNVPDDYCYVTLSKEETVLVPPTLPPVQEQSDRSTSVVEPADGTVSAPVVYKT